MFTEKQEVLSGAAAALNKPDRPWEVTVEGNSIVARWKWMDAVFFAPSEVNAETKEYTFTVVLNDKGKWSELDKTEETSKGASFSDGKLKFGASKDMFAGKKSQKSISFGVGKDKQTGESGLIKHKFDTSSVKQPVREYLTNCGWKKAGLFG